jgi:hypothetical protein
MEAATRLVAHRGTEHVTMRKVTDAALARHLPTGAD